MSWGNGRSTIYHRFIESISLTEEEELSIRQYRNTQSVSLSSSVSDSIQLPDFNELHSDVEESDFADRTDSEIQMTSVEDVSVLSEVSVHVSPPVEIESETYEFERFGISIDLSARGTGGDPKT